MEGPWGHYGKWNKSDTEREIFVWSHLYTDSKNK